MPDTNDLSTPFDQSWPTPDVGGTGANGIGGGLDVGSGPNGITNPAFDQAVVPTPSGAWTPCADLGFPPPDTVEIEGGSPAGSQFPEDVTSSRNTVDRK